jgi:hypothetical protein
METSSENHLFGQRNDVIPGQIKKFPVIVTRGMGVEGSFFPVAKNTLSLSLSPSLSLSATES